MQKRFDNVLNKQGNALQGIRVSVQVYPGATPASIYASNGTDLIGGSYVTTDALGYYEYYAEDGRYIEVISGPGIETETINDILIEDATSDLADSTDATLGDALVAVKLEATGSVARTQHDKNADFVSVLDFVPVALVSGILARTDATDLSAYIQAGIDALALRDGGILYFPSGRYTGNVTLKEGVVLWGAPVTHVPWNSEGVRLDAAATGIVIDTPVAETRSCGVVGIGIQGLGSGTACKGIRFRDVARGMVKGCTFNNFSDEALLEDSGCVACAYEDLFAQNCLLDRSQAAKIGAFDFGGTDQHVSRVEGTASVSALSDANAYLCGVVVRGDNGFYSSVIGEISDEGIHVVSGATLNRFTDCRADLNLGNGWNVVGTDNTFENCHGINNSQETTNTYDNWVFASSSGSNQTTNCKAYSNVAKVARYGFNDLVASATTKNRHINPLSTGAGTAEYLNDNANGSAFHFPENMHVTFTANTTTPSIAGLRYFRTANSNPTTITNFTGGVSGQQIQVLCNDANTTIQHNGSTITLIGAGNKKLRSGVIYKFIKTSAVWRETTELPLGVTADVGNAAKTLQYRLDEETQIWATTLTADRAVTLSTTGAIAGAKFRIVRTATGAFNLNVGTGPLKALGIGTWCDVEYNGSAWVLTAYGAL